MLVLMRNKPDLRPNRSQPSSGSTVEPKKDLKYRDLHQLVQQRYLGLQQQIMRQRKLQPGWIKNGPLALHQDPALRNLFFSLPPQQQLMLVRAINYFQKNLNGANIPLNNNQPTNSPDLDPASTQNLMLNPANSLIYNEVLANQAQNNINDQNLQEENIKADAILSAQNIELQNVELNNFEEALNEDELDQKTMNQQQPSPSPSFNLDEDDLKNIEEMKKPIEKVHEVEIFKKAIGSLHKKEFIEAITATFEKAEEGFGFKNNSVPTLTR